LFTKVGYTSRHLDKDFGEISRAVEPLDDLEATALFISPLGRE
jgi:hypothetical protein